MCQGITNNCVCFVYALLKQHCPFPVDTHLVYCGCTEKLTVLWSRLLRKVVPALSFGWKNSSDLKNELLLKQNHKCLNG